MSHGIACRDQSHRWVVVQRHGNASAFAGYQWTPSKYSLVRCLDCFASWRTRADYVERLPDAPLEHAW